MLFPRPAIPHLSPFNLTEVGKDIFLGVLRHLDYSQAWNEERLQLSDSYAVDLYRRSQLRQSKAQVPSPMKTPPVCPLHVRSQSPPSSFIVNQQPVGRLDLGGQLLAWLPWLYDTMRPLSSPILLSKSRRSLLLYH